MNLRSRRNALGVSQSKLARMSRVSRFKLNVFELGSGSLSRAEQDRIQRALRAEADRLRKISTQIDLGRLAPEEECAVPGKAPERARRSSRGR